LNDFFCPTNIVFLIPTNCCLCTFRNNFSVIVFDRSDLLHCIYLTQSQCFAFFHFRQTQHLRNHIFLCVQSKVYLSEPFESCFPTIVFAIEIIRQIINISCLLYILDLVLFVFS
jgi:hypothetical protein